jgi:hypothetical protein
LLLLSKNRPVPHSNSSYVIRKPKHQTINKLRTTKQSRQLLFVPFCVRTERQLRRAVNRASTFGPDYTRIHLCAKTIKISNYVDPSTGISGINVSNKWIELTCKRWFGRRCSLDGLDLYSILYGENTSLRVSGVDFVNGKSDPGSSYLFGGALRFKDSVVSISESSIRNNKGHGHSALVVFYSIIVLQNVAFMENEASVSSLTQHE